jgi:hypothetical protein
MKKFLLCLALLIGFADGSILKIDGFPRIFVSLPTMEFFIEGLPIPIPISDVLVWKYIPDNLVM